MCAMANCRTATAVVAGGRGGAGRGSPIRGRGARRGGLGGRAPLGARGPGSSWSRLDTRTTTTVRVVELPEGVDLEGIKGHFAQFGHITSVEADPAGGARVAFEARKQAEEALKGGKKLGESTMILQWATASASSSTAAPTAPQLQPAAPATGSTAPKAPSASGSAAETTLGEQGKEEGQETSAQLPPDGAEGDKEPQADQTGPEGNIKKPQAAGAADAEVDKEEPLDEAAPAAAPSEAAPPGPEDPMSSDTQHPQQEQPEERQQQQEEEHQEEQEAPGAVAHDEEEYVELVDEDCGGPDEGNDAEEEAAAED